MARSRPAAPSVPKENRVLRQRGNRASGVLACCQRSRTISGHSCHDSTPEVAKPPSVSPQVTIRDEPQDEVFPSGVWTIISPNGCIKCTYDPIPGFEELRCPTAQMQGFPNPVPGRPSTVVQPPHQATATQVPSTSQEPRKRKRSQSIACERNSEQPIAQNFSDSKQDKEDASEKSYTFYINDINELRKFFKCRLRELTMKPLRPIITAWIKLLEPKRLSLYGPYHKMLPEDQPPRCTPPWWPRDVPYEEPSHLNRTELSTLAIDIMLQHHRIDKAKPRGSLVAKFQQAAIYAVEATPADQFSSSNDPAASKSMKERALNVILPDLFNTVELYEQHFVQYELCEGTGRTDPGHGTRVTWHRLTRPPRQAAPRKKRGRQTKAAQAPTTEPDVDASGSETEVDNALHLQRTRQARSQAQQPQNPSGLVSRRHAPETPAPAVPAGASAPSISQQDGHFLSLAAPNTSFEQLNEEMASHTRHNDPVLVQSMYPSNMPMQYFTSHDGYNFPVFRHQEGIPSPHSTQFSFGSRHVPSFAHQLSVFDAPCPPQDNTFAAPMASNNAGSPYEYEGAFPSTPMSDHSNRPFHGLPIDTNPNY